MSSCDPMIVSNAAECAALDFHSVKNASQVVDNVCLNTMECRSDGKKIHNALFDTYWEGVPCLFQLSGNLMPTLSI